MLRPVFSDTFTETVDRNIDTYPVGNPDYAYNLGSGDAIQVNAANDRLQHASLSSSAFAYVIDPAVVGLKDYEVHAAVCRITASDSITSVAARILTSVSSGDGYFVDVHVAVANEIEVYRMDNGVSVLLASEDRGLANADQDIDMRMRVTGSGDFVSLTVTVNNTSPVTVVDNATNRKTSGAPGIFFNNNISLYLDTFDVSSVEERLDYLHFPKYKLRRFGLFNSGRSQ